MTRSRAALAIGLMTVLQYAATAEAQSATANKIARRTLPAVVAIETFDAAGKPISQGSGFVVGANGVLLGAGGSTGMGGVSLAFRGRELCDQQRRIAEHPHDRKRVDAAADRRRNQRRFARPSGVSPVPSMGRRPGRQSTFPCHRRKRRAGRHLPRVRVVLQGRVGEVVDPATCSIVGASSHRASIRHAETIHYANSAGAGQRQDSSPSPRKERCSRGPRTPPSDVGSRTGAPRQHIRCAECCSRKAAELLQTSFA